MSTTIFDVQPTLAIEFFNRGTSEACQRVFEDESTLNEEALTDGAVYAAPTVFQLKAMLFHAGIVTERGAEPHRLDPAGDVWTLREPL